MVWQRTEDATVEDPEADAPPPRRAAVETLGAGTCRCKLAYATDLPTKIVPTKIR